MPKRAIYSFILIIIAGLFVGFFVVNRNAGISRPGFDLEAIAPQLAPFKDFYRAKVLNISDEHEITGKTDFVITQTVAVHFLTGAQAGKEADLEFRTSSRARKLKAGDTVVVASAANPDQTGGQEFIITDRYRLPQVGIAVTIFVLLAIVFGRLRGVTSLVGLAFSMFVLVYFIAPNILSGRNPVMISLLGAFIIALVSIFLAHGFKARTALAVISTIITLGLAEGLAYIAVRGMLLAGNGSEEAFLLQGGTLGAFDLRGLLLASILIGTLGILDDVTTAQSAAVDEIHRANPKLSFLEMYRSGMSVGREHIASLINTLVLAYAGAFFPLFLIIVLLGANQPLWTTLNSEFIVEEIVRTLVGSAALILAVPLSTLLAAYYFRGVSAGNGAPPAKHDALPVKQVVSPVSEDGYWDRARRKLLKK